MNITVYKGKQWLIKIENATMTPRIGESICLYSHIHKVKDIIWHTTEAHPWIEIQVY